MLLQGMPKDLTPDAGVLAKPPKVERHDLRRREHHTNTGIRAVERYQVHAAGLAVVRPFTAHPRIRAWQAHLLPALGLQVCRYEFHGPREHDYYIDLATISQAGGIWTLTDHYLDVLVWEGARRIDRSRMNSGRGAGGIPSVSPGKAVWAQAQALLLGLAEHGHDLQAYLAAQNVRLYWVDQNRVDWDGRQSTRSRAGSQAGRWWARAEANSSPGSVFRPPEMP